MIKKEKISNTQLPNNQLPWTEKYRPKKIDDIIQDKSIKDLFDNCISTKNIPHFLFYGSQGTGKTSSILALGRELFKEYYSERVIEFNASDDRGINAVREKITRDAKVYSYDKVASDGSKIPPYKIIILDEADSMTEEAQNALRVIIEEYSVVTRFCFICNYITKITSAIKSRCSLVYFNRLTKDLMKSKLKNVAEKENMQLYDNIYNTIIDVTNGDMRNGILLLQNLKYTYEYKQLYNSNVCDIPVKKLITIYGIESNISKDVSEDDVYILSASINLKIATEYLENIKSCKKIEDIIDYTNKLISNGYPIENILTQIDKVILADNSISDCKKANIFINNIKIIYNLKEFSNVYIQLIYYITYINKIYNEKD